MTLIPSSYDSGDDFAAWASRLHRPGVDTRRYGSDGGKERVPWP